MNATLIADDEAWAAVLRRDRAYDGRFVTGVLTTGIYCRPSCAARHPHRDNVRIFANGEEAREAGLRPCLRCLPDDLARDEQAVLRAIKAIKAAEAPLPLAQLAGAAGYSPSHFQRVFTRLTGLSPATYARALKKFGDNGVVSLSGLNGYYVMLAMMLNVAHTPVAKPANPPMPMLPR